MIKIGLEIHQQLDTHKLFCSCPSELEDDFAFTFKRTLRPTRSEMGIVDAAALEEAEKHRVFYYQICRGSCCLVEADEEPPHAVNQEAVQTGLEIARLMNAKYFPETYFMRKLVIDGSNTSGFQRTALIAVDGELELDVDHDERTPPLRVGIETICLEEDAARKIDEGEPGENIVNYRLDRLGIPLVEITTAPDIHDARTAVTVARMIGSYLRATRKVKRGLGTIRQDVNISIPGGTRVEVKGVQDLHAMESIINGEIARQKRLLEAAQILKERDVEKDDISLEGLQDLSSLFCATSSRVIKTALDKGGRVFCLCLPGFAGLLGPLEKNGPRCLGPELAGRIRVLGIKGLFHTDELPAYGITAREVEAAREVLQLSTHDAFVLVATTRDLAQIAMREVVERAREALRGVPPEVRHALDDGSTIYLRPVSGSARMYPETDVFPLKISKERFQKIILPELPGKKLQRYTRDFTISTEQARQLLATEQDIAFEELVHPFPGEGRFAAHLLLNVLPELERLGIHREAITMEMLAEAIALHGKKGFSKEAISKILHYCGENGTSVKFASRSLHLEAMEEEKVLEVLRQTLQEREDFVRERGLAALGALMGIVMGKLKGQARGKTVSGLLKQELEAFMKRQGQA